MTSPINHELSAQISEWRTKAADGTLSPDDMKAIIAQLRQGRLSAAEAAQVAAKTRKKAIAVIPDAGSLLDELADL